VAREKNLVDAAHELGLTYAKAYQLVLTRQLDGRREGRSWVVTSQSIEAYRRAQARTATPATV
jgi:hypothetical protein